MTKPARDAPLFERALGSHWHALPPALRTMHDVDSHRVAVGSALIERGGTLTASLIARLFGFPDAGNNVPVTVTFTTCVDGGETWTRNFGGKTFTSRLEPSPRTSPDCGYVIERLGPFAFELELRPQDGRLQFTPVHWRMFGIPLPTALCPGGNSYEFTGSNDSFAFHIEIRMPLAGVIVRYVGALRPVS